MLGWCPGQPLSEKLLKLLVWCVQPPVVLDGHELRLQEPQLVAQLLPAGGEGEERGVQDGQVLGVEPMFVKAGTYEKIIEGRIFPLYTSILISACT